MDEIDLFELVRKREQMNLKNTGIPYDLSPATGSGRITTEYTFWCAGCLEWEQLSTEKKSIAVGQAKTLGWKQKGNPRKWYCPKCSNDQET